MFMTCQTRASYERKIEKLEGDYQSLIQLNNQIYNEQERLRRVASQCKTNATHLERKVKLLEEELKKKVEHNAEEKRKGEINHAIQKLEELRDTGGSIDLVVGVDESVCEYNVGFTILHETGGAVNLDKVRELYKNVVRHDLERYRRWGRGKYRKSIWLENIEAILKALGIFEKITDKKGK